MLTLVFGRDRTERVRSVAAVVAALVAVTSLSQLAAQRSADDSRSHQEAAVLALAGHFAEALTTYDYAHPKVQITRLTQVADSDVITQVARAAADLQVTHASAIGEATASWVIQLGASNATAIVSIRETVSNGYAGAGRQMEGLVECRMTRRPWGWRVGAFRWIQVPAPPQSIDPPL